METNNGAWVRFVANTHVFAPYILNGAPLQAYHFDYQDGEILRYAIDPLPESLENQDGEYLSLP